jgi:signal transduction histidine kinase
LAPIEVEEIMSGVAQIGRLIAAKKKITLLVEPAAGAPRLVADAAKLQQVLLNLVANAVEHSQPGQRVWLASYWQPSELCFSVRDEGPGLAPEDQARLFLPFGRGGTRKTAGERSVGLGLAIARSIVEAHEGRIWVESIPGYGATFVVALPVQT